jgi:hypothetical protein
VGVLALLIDGSVLMPGIQRQLNGHNLWEENVPRWASWITHITFGVAMGWFYWRWQPPTPRDSAPSSGGRAEATSRSKPGPATSSDAQRFDSSRIPLGSRAPCTGIREAALSSSRRSSDVSSMAAAPRFSSRR